MTRLPLSVGALLLLGLTLSAAIAVQLAAPRPEDGDPWVMPEAAAVSEAADAGSAPVGGANPVGDILERPLFHPRRRLYSVLEMPLGGLPLAEPNGRLVGVMIGTAGREALFAEVDNHVVRIKQGGVRHGWIVETIDADRVILVSKLGQRTMNLGADHLHAATQVPLAGAEAIAVPAGQSLWSQLLASTPPDPATKEKPSEGRPATSGRRNGEAR